MNINNFTQWKNGSVGVTITLAITQQKHLMQCGQITRSAVGIFNTFHVFTKEPIRERETKLECMNWCFTIPVAICWVNQKLAIMSSMLLISNATCFEVFRCLFEKVYSLGS